MIKKKKNDNFMVRTQTYDNVIFSNMDNQFTYNVYEQSKKLFATSYATVDAWNNVNLGIKKKGKDDLKEEDFPTSKPFKVGSSLMNEKYNMSYENYISQARSIYFAKDAVLSDDVKVKDNRAYISEENGYIKFENVNFKDKQILNILFSADYYKQADQYEIIIGSTMEDGEKFNVNLTAQSKNLLDITNETDDIQGYLLDDVNNVWIKGKKCGNAGIYGIVMTQRYINNIGTKYDYKKIYGGTFSYFGKSHIQERPQPSMRSGVDRDYPILMGSWGQGWVKYGNVTVDETVTKFRIQIASGEPWDKNGISLRIGSPDGEVLARIESDNSNWEYVEKTAELSRPLKSGTYDMYLTFDGDDKCSDIYWFGLY